MPWSVTAESGKCPASKPWAVVKDSDGTVEGCHPSEEAAQAQQAALYASERKDMTEGTVKARVAIKATATVATEAGQFTAIAAAYTIDRDKEFIRPGAFANTIKAWQGRNKPIPLHWAHQGDPESIIGAVDPGQMEETDDGLFVAGKVDLESEKGAEAWRLVKSGTVGLSFGFLGQMGEKSEDGTREIVEIDLFEVSLTPAPANPDTRILSWKSVELPAPDAEELKRQSRQLERDLVKDKLPEPVENPPEASQEPLELPAEFEAALQMLKDKVAALEARPERSADDLRRDSERVARDLIAKELPAPKEPDPEPEVHKVKRLMSDLQRQLQEAGGKRFGASDDTWVYVEDFDAQENFAIFCVSESSPYRERHVKVAFTQGEAETVLSQDETEVERVTQFRPKASPEGETKEQDVTDKGRKSVRSVDPLRREQQQALLASQLDGLSLPKPPDKDPDPEPLDAKRLRRESKQTMLELLTGATE